MTRGVIGWNARQSNDLLRAVVVWYLSEFMVEISKFQMPLVVDSSFGQRVVGGFGLALATVFYTSTILLFNVLQTLSLLVKPFSEKTFRSINRNLANTWWAWCVLGAEKIYGMKPIFSGDDIPSGENAILFANHQQMPDILVIMCLAIRKKRLGDMKWFVKHPLKYFPGIGWGMQFLDCIFVKRDWHADKRKVLGTFEKFLSKRIPIWLITFVEGTRITPEKLARSHKYCSRKGLPLTKHVMVPRTRGFTAALEGLEGHLDAVYDVTIGYENGIPRLRQVYRGQVKRVFIDVRRFPVSALPETEPERAAWLQARFVRKDQILDELSKTGRFPS